MDIEEFKQKYEGLKDNPMYKNFCSILDTKNQVLERTAKKNQELKKQLHEASLQIQSLIEEDMSCPSNCSKLRKLRNQQKEFIEWLEDKINFWKDKIFENAITENDWTLTLWRNKLGILEESLSKYKEIIGGSDGEN